ncbi:hypothetical protein DH2020_015269 [Rehmannia glutinosa]|uniref:Ty3 transposon capsid-like protein domain-containing protein n=1 Tax=Rehmannia glutinosa TaxID=99300 RepID=A0ABR0WSA1_REHGL
MAEGTRLKDLQEAQKRIDQILQTESMKREAAEIKLQEQISGINSEVQEQLSGLNGRYEHLTNTLAAIQLQLLNLNKGKNNSDEESILGGPYPGSTGEGTSFRIQQQSPRSRTPIDQQGMNIINPLPKIDFPRFDGSQPRSWILKCNGYFKLIPNIPDNQKVTLASMHFEGRAAHWYQNFNTKQVNLTWAQFVEIVSSRFEELKEAKIIGEFNKLKHTGSYAEYVDKFEELQACMLMLNKGNYTEEYFVASFISGLSEESQAFINMFEPTTLQQTIELGRKQLCTMEAITKKVKGPARTSLGSYSNTNIRRVESSPQVPSNRPQCKNRVTYMIMTEDEELSYLQDHTEQGPEVVIAPMPMEEVQMSLNAITGEDGITTMRLFGESNGHKLHILIDSGSTLSFIQESTAKKLGCQLEVIKPLLVKVANGQRMVSSHRAKEFQWEMQGHTFSYPLRVLQNEGCDLILGGDWLKSCTPIELDYERMTFTIYPLEVLDSRWIRRKGEDVQQILVHWVNSSSDLSTWEDLKFIQKTFPQFDPWGQGSTQPGGIVMNSLSRNEIFGREVGIEDGNHFAVFEERNKHVGIKRDFGLSQVDGQLETIG